MIKINVVTNNINWLRYLKNPNNYLEKKIVKLNVKEKKFKKKNIFFTILLSDNKKIKYLNKKFRKKNKSTDILSFPFQTKTDLSKKLKIEKDIYLGDIIINLSKIKKKKNIRDFKIEFDKMWIHGLVHLFGHDHKKEKEYLKMNKIEKKYLKLLNA
tara:strand:+ start:5852 stop:6319 length:468 start_codon:yes stop_codon:yes gene_type:complete